MNVFSTVCVVLSYLPKVLQSIILYCSSALFCAVDDVHELGLEGSTSDQEPVDVGLGIEVITVGGRGRTTVNDAGSVRNLGINLLAKPLTDLLVGVLCLLRSSHDTSTDGPHGLVSNHHVLPVTSLEGSLDGLELLGAHSHGAAVLAVLELLTNASHDGHAGIDGILGLHTHHVAGLAIIAKPDTTFRVSGEGPGDARIDKQLSAHLSRHGTEATLESDVFGASGDVRTKRSLHLGKMNSRAGNGDLRIGREGTSGVKHVDHAFDLGHSAIALPVSTCWMFNSSFVVKMT